MRAREIELALRKQRLQLRSAELRSTLVLRCDEIAAPLRRGQQGWQRLRTLFGQFRSWTRGNPRAARLAAGVATGGLLAGAFRQRRSLGRLVMRAVSAWQLWRRLGELLQRR